VAADNHVSGEDHVGAQMFMQAMEGEGIKQFSVRPNFGDVARFEFFANGSERKFGVWVVRQPGMQFALPFVTGPKAATSDYEPMPHGFPVWKYLWRKSIRASYHSWNWKTDERLPRLTEPMRLSPRRTG